MTTPSAYGKDANGDIKQTVLTLSANKTIALTGTNDYNIYIDETQTMSSVLTSNFNIVSFVAELPTTVATTATYVYYVTNEHRYYYTSGSTTASWVTKIYCKVASVRMVSSAITYFKPNLQLNLAQKIGKDKLLMTMADINANTDKEFVPSAVAVKELSTGWTGIFFGDKLTYNTASAPSFVCNTLNVSNVAKDFRPYLSVGMKLKLTQDAVVKYFFVTAIDATSITLYGGTDYTLTNTAITNVCYSVVKSPYGFPLNPDKWSVQTIVNTFSRLSDNGTFPGIGLTIPIGEWNATVKLTGAVWGNAGYWNGFTVKVVDQFREYCREIIVSPGDPTGIPNRHSVFMKFNMVNTVASNIVLTGVKYSAQTTSMEIAGSEAPTILTATCAYL